MNRRRLFWILTILLGFIFQVTFSDLISVFGIFPNLLLLTTIFFAVRGGPIVGEWAGFAWGLLSDVASISIFGSQTFMLTLVGYVVGRLQGKIDEEKSAAQMAVVFLMSVLYIFGLVFFETLFGGNLQRFKVMASYFQPLYSTLICPAVFWVLLKWCDLFYRHDFKARA